METSAKVTVNVEETFALIVRRVMEARKAAAEQPLRGGGSGVVSEKKAGQGQVASSKVNDEKAVDNAGRCKCCIIN